MEEPWQDHAADDVALRRLEEQLEYYGRSADQAKNAYKRVKLAQITIGAVIPVLAAAGVTGWVTASVAAVPVIAEGSLQLFQWHSHWLRWRSAAEALKKERLLYVAGIGHYSGDDRREVLAARVVVLIEQETSDWATTRSSESDKGLPRSTSGSP
ncbi:DUF4231 domain-containing protein [Nocardia asteroides]|uniref:DUF4231 domain-containing protein n=1 Tax=Nocardia asteroides TaxID=1824 RepID=UPI00378D24F9